MHGVIPLFGRRVWIGLAAGAAAVLLCALPVRAQLPFGQRMVLMQAVRGNWMQFNIVSGRIQVSSSQFINVSNGSERLSIRPDGAQSVVEYEATLPDELFRFEVKDPNRIHVRREPRGKSTFEAADFLQAPAQPLTLTVTGSGKTAVYQADGLWQLLLLEPDVCRKHLVPMLELLRPDWRLANKAVEIEEELLLSASSGQLPDRRRWDELVRQLGDERFARRQAADRELRAAGPAVMAYLGRLDFAKLQPEQQARVRRILAELSQDVDDDTVSQVAVGLAIEPAVWVGLLSRPAEGVRRQAAAELSILLGGPIDFDPMADLAVRQAQIERIRARITAR